MRICGYKKCLILSVLVMGGGVSALWGLSFEELLPSIETSPQVTEARLAVQAAAQQYTIARFAGDASLTLTPGIEAVSLQDGDFAEQREITAAISSTVPVGLDSGRKADAEAAKDALVRAEKELEYSRYRGYLSLYEAYAEAVLAQEETAVLEAELAAAHEKARIVNSRFESGSASYQEVNDAEDELREAEAASLQGGLDSRLRWLELAYAGGLNQGREEALEPIEVTFPELPKPPELSIWARDNSPLIAAYNDQIRAVQRDIEAAGGSILAPTVRMSFSGWDQSGSLSYNIEDPEIGLSYSLPLLSSGTDLDSSSSGSGGGSEDTWKLGLSVNIPLKSGGSDRLQTDLALLRIRQTEQQRALALETLGLQIRSSYQQYVLADEYLAQAARSLEFAEATYTAIYERRQREQATAAEELLVRAQVERARFRNLQAELKKDLAALQTAGAAFYLNNFIR